MDVSPSLTSLDLSECPALKTVQLCASGLTSLDVTKNPKIEFLQVFATSSFKELTMGANPALATLKCQDTNIQTLDVSNCNMKMAEITANPNTSLSTIILREGQVVSNFSYPSTTQLNYVK
jgi:Leucine-rich repeat (LRR) protein